MSPKGHPTFVEEGGHRSLWGHLGSGLARPTTRLFFLEKFYLIKISLMGCVQGPLAHSFLKWCVSKLQQVCPKKKHLFSEQSLFWTGATPNELTWRRLYKHTDSNLFHHPFSLLVASIPSLHCQERVLLLHSWFASVTQFCSAANVCWSLYPERQTPLKPISTVVGANFVLRT